MRPVVLRHLTKAEFDTLLTWASRQPDFAYIGSSGEGADRGWLSGFSCQAIARRTLNNEIEDSDAVEALADQMESQRRDFAVNNSEPSAYLTGGWIGYISYEFGYIRETKLSALCPASPVPLLSVGLYLWTASHNRKTGEYFLWSHEACPEHTLEQLQSVLDTPGQSATPAWRMTAPFQARQTADDFRGGVSQVKDYIEAGDCYQANLSQEFTGTYSGNPWAAFQALSRANPTPYSAFIRADNFSVVSLSPERFLEIDRSIVKTSPIKGTRPRGDTPEGDAALAQELQASEKDRAENLMIVDLLRNDLGLNARTGSVRVDELFALESYRNVHHLVSHIQAELADGVSPLKALFDAFPGGSITGAPKVRAMEIIRELEPHWRGPYCGSVFYYGLDGRLDSSIAIRTLLCDESTGTIRCWGGGGIVADSDPEAEYQETLAKVGPLMRFLEELEIG